MAYEGKPALKVLLGEYPKTEAIRSGRLTSDLAELEIADFTDAQKGFKLLMRERAFDFAEVALMTFLIGRDWGKPYVLLPYVMNGAFHHGSLYYNTAQGELNPKDLEGKRIGLRAWSQTTPTWVRGYLADDYGVDLTKIDWVTFEDSHIGEYRDPPYTTRAPAGSKLQEMVLSGELDGAMLGNRAPEDDRIRRMIPDFKAAALAWHERHKAVPINHMVVVKQELLDSRPDIVRDLFGLLVEARDQAGGPKIQDGIDLQPVGLPAIRNALELGCDYAFRQGLTRRKFTVDELFTPFTASLGA